MSVKQNFSGKRRDAAKALQHVAMTHRRCKKVRRLGEIATRDARSQCSERNTSEALTIATAMWTRKIGVVSASNLE